MAWPFGTSFRCVELEARMLCGLEGGVDLIRIVVGADITNLENIE